MRGRPRDDHALYQPPGGHRSRRRRRLIVAATVLAGVVAVCAVVASILVSRSHRESFDTPVTADPTATVAIGMPIRDADIEFRVQSVRPLPAAPGAAAQHIQVVALELTNTGTAPRSVSIGDQVLIDDRGHEYHGNPVISSQLNSADGTLSLQPGATGTMNIPFDVPTGAHPALVVLRADPSTPGVAVTLTSPSP